MEMQGRHTPAYPERRRYFLLDAIRGLTILSMVLYHAVWDCVHLLRFEWSWFAGSVAYLWQQSICWTFILLSGFCCALGRHPIKRGLTVLAAGALVTIVTLVLLPEHRVVFGVLTLLGIGMLLAGAARRLLVRLPAFIGAPACLLLFLILKPLNQGYLNLGLLRLPVPEELYHGYLATLLGFRDPTFFSTDYFSIFPWIFLFFTGYYLYRLIENSSVLEKYGTYTVPPLAFVGRHSLLLYLLHQPLLYGVMMALEAILPS